MEIRSSKQKISLRETEGQASKTLTGYIAVYESDSVDLGGYIEQIAPGAFAESLARNDVVALINHDHSVVVGRLSSGTLRLTEDDKGLAFEIDLPDTQAGRDLAVLVRRGDLLGCSFGFGIDEVEWTERDGVPFSLLKKIDLQEVSVGVTFPAYEATSMQLRMKKSLDGKARAKARLKIEEVTHR